MDIKTTTKAELDKLRLSEQPVVYENPYVVYEAPTLVRNVLLGAAQLQVDYTTVSDEPNYNPDAPRG